MAMGVKKVFSFHNLFVPLKFCGSPFAQKQGKEKRLPRVSQINANDIKKFA